MATVALELRVEADGAVLPRFTTTLRFTDAVVTAVANDALQSPRKLYVVPIDNVNPAVATPLYTVGGGTISNEGAAVIELAAGQSLSVDDGAATFAVTDTALWFIGMGPLNARYSVVGGSSAAPARALVVSPGVPE
jgi:hypothetical protein